MDFPDEKKLLESLSNEQLELVGAWLREYAQSYRDATDWHRHAAEAIDYIALRADILAQLERPSQIR